PGESALAIMGRHVNDAVPRADCKRGEMIPHGLDRIGDLAVVAIAQLVEEAVAHRGGIEAGRAEAIEVNIAFFQREELTLPRIGNRAFLGQKRPRAELEGDRPELGITDPVLPFLEAPDAASHDDRCLVEAEFAHQLPEFEHARKRRLRHFRILAIGDAVMAAGEPRIFVDDRAHKIAEFMIGTFPERPEGAARRHDRIVIDAVTLADFGDLVGHAGAAGDAVDEATRAFEDAVQDALGGCHFPQDVHVDAALPIRALIGDARLMDAARDREGDQLLMPLAPSAALVDLFELVAIRIEAIGIDAREGADTAARRPGAGTLAVGHGNALAAFDQRQHIAPGNEQRFKRLHETLPPPMTIASPRMGCRQSPALPFSRLSLSGLGLRSLGFIALSSLFGELRADILASGLVDLLHRQLDLAAIVEAQHLDLDLVADLHHVGGLGDALRGEFADMDEAVARAEEIDEGAEIDGFHDLAVVDHIDLGLGDDAANPVDRRLCRIAINRRDLDRAVVLDIDLRAGDLADLADDLAA